MKDITHEQLIRATYVTAKYEGAQMAQLLTELAGRLDGALTAARTACAERATAMNAEIEWETTMREATGADNVDDVVSVIEKLKSDLAEMASENLTLKDAMKNGVVEPHQMTSRGVSIGVKNVIVNREIKTPATDSFLAEVRAQGIHFAVNRMLAAWESGFVNDTPAQAYDISGGFLTALEFLPNASPDEFKRDYADEVRSAIAAQLRGEKTA